MSKMTASDTRLPGPKGILEGVIGNILFVTVPPAALYLFRAPLGPMIRAYPATSVVTAAGAGSLLTLAAVYLYRQRRRRSATHQYATVHVRLPSDLARGDRNVAVPVIPTHHLSWEDYLLGIKLLNNQIAAENWTPDLVVAINQGNALVGLLGANKLLQGVRFGSIHLDRDRKLQTRALPKREEFSSPAKVLLVDYQMKKGTAFTAALAKLKEELGVEIKDVRVAVMVLGSIRSELPNPDVPAPLYDPKFDPAFGGFTPEELRARVERIYYLAFLCQSYPTPPWTYEASASD